MSEEKFYYAKQCDSSNFNFEDYWPDEDQFEEDHIWIGGNRDFTNVNDSLYTDTVKNLDNAIDDIDTIRSNEDYTLIQTLDEIMKTIKYYFQKDNGNELTTAEIQKLVAICDKRYSGPSEIDIVCEILEVIYDQKFKTATLRGYSQGDWVDIIYPESTAQSYIDWLEALYFGTATEFEITCSKVSENEVDDADTYYDCTTAYGIDAVKQWLADDVIGCSVDEIKVKLIDYDGELEDEWN